MKNTFVKVLSFLMALTMIVGTLGTVVVFAADTCAHVKANNEPVKDVEPTCAKPGFKSYICALCNQEFVPDDEVILPSAKYHNIQTVDPIEASCITDAYSGGQRCVNENCPDPESTYVGVQNLGGQKKHSFKKVEVAATCSTPGGYEYLCTTCNLTADQIETKRLEAVAAGNNNIYKWVGQDYDDWKFVEDTNKPATDTNHTKLVWTILSAPVKGSATVKCADGSAKGVCASCGFTRTAVLPAPHVYNKPLNATGSTCADYKPDSMACSLCGQVSPSAERWDEDEKTDHGVEDAIAKSFYFDDGIEEIDGSNLPYRLDRDPDDGKGPVRITLAELRELGLDDGDKTYIAPGCITVGYELVECVCGELVYKELPALGHNVFDTAEAWDNISTVDWAEYCTEDSVKVQVCGRDGCDYTITKVVQPKVNAEHPYTVTTVHATCYEVGYKTGECKVKFFIKDGAEEVTCGHKTDKYDYEDMLVHSYGPVKLKSDTGTCVTGEYVQTCTNLNLNVTGTPACGHEIPATKPENATCQFGAWTTVAGTCVTPSYQTRTCSVCHTTERNANFTGATNAANHEYSHKGWVSDKVPTCTTGATEIIWCTKCSEDEAVRNATITTREVAANTNGTVNATHKFTASYAEIIDGVLYLYGVAGKDESDNTDTVKYLANASTTVAKAATCQADGYKVGGQYCENCGAVKAGKAAKVITKESVQGNLAAHIDPALHPEEGQEALQPFAQGDATCQRKAWKSYNTSCCGIVTIEEGDKATCSYVLVPYQAPTCTAVGNHAHEACQWCGTHKAGSTSVVTTLPEAVEEPAEGEDRAEYDAYVLATKQYCALNCSNHNAIMQDVSDNYVIAALGHDLEDHAAEKSQPVYEEDGVTILKTSCETTGKAAYKECVRCNVIKVYNNKTYDISDETQAAQFALDIIVPAHYNAHKITYTQQTKIPATCTSYGTNVGTWCTVCDDLPEGQLDPWVADKAPHSYKDFTINAAGADYDCTLPTATVRTCMVCGDHTSTYEDAANPNGHDYKKYTVGNLTNQEWSAPYLQDPVNDNHCVDPYYKKKECNDCGHYEEVVAEAATGHWTTKGVVGGTKYPISVKCNEIQNYIGQTCGDCGVTFTANHKVHTMVTQKKAPTCTTEGYTISFCSACNDQSLYTYTKVAKCSETNTHTKGEIIEQVPATSTTAGYEKFVCTACTDAAKAVDPNAADVVVTVELKATATLTVAGTASAEKVTAGTGLTYTVSYSGKAQEFKNIKIEVSYDASKFEFKAATSALTSNIFTSTYTKTVGDVEVDYVGITLVKSTAMTTTVEGTDLVTLEFVAKKYAAGNDNAFDVAKINETAVVADASLVDVVGLGNPTGTGYVTGEDALAILELDDASEYDASYDINGDGMIDAIDVILVGTFSASAQTAKDYLIMLGTYDEIKATIEAYYADGLLADVTGDGNININDYYKLSTAVDAELATYTSYTAIDFASVEDLVMSVMISLIEA